MGPMEVKEEREGTMEEKEEREAKEGITLEMMGMIVTTVPREEKEEKDLKEDLVLLWFLHMLKMHSNQHTRKRRNQYHMERHHQLEVLIMLNKCLKTTKDWMLMKQKTMFHGRMYHLHQKRILKLHLPQYSPRNNSRRYKVFRHQSLLLFLQV